MSNYLSFNLDESLPKRKYLIYRDENLVFDFTASISNERTPIQVYADIRRFGEGNYEVKSEDGIPVAFDFANGLPSRDKIESGKELRPVIHYTAPIGWINDPNGLVFADGRYHLFCQHNPFSRVWGNMSWIHAVSDDLLHWEDLGDALFPDETGTMFSGSAVEDKENVAGFGKGAILLFYTAAGNYSLMSKDKSFTQCLAYSTDGGHTFAKYDYNPIIPHIVEANRDPKVVYSDELQKWVLALYLDKNDFRLFLSDNLKSWEEWETVTMETDTECPNFYPLKFGDETVWVFSGAADKYMLYKITDGKLILLQNEEKLTFNGSYAAQVYSGTEPKTIRLSWLRTDTGDAVFNSQMSVPTEMFLKEDNGKIRLGSYPIRALFENMRTVKFDGDNTVIASGAECENSAAVIDIDFDADISGFNLSVFGCDVNVFPKSNKFIVNGNEVPLDFSDKKSKRLCLVADTLSVECFADGGLIYANYLVNADRNKCILLQSETDQQIGIRIGLIRL